MSAKKWIAGALVLPLLFAIGGCGKANTGQNTETKMKEPIEHHDVN